MSPVSGGKVRTWLATKYEAIRTTTKRWSTIIILAVSLTVYAPHAFASAYKDAVNGEDDGLIIPGIIVLVAIRHSRHDLKELGLTGVLPGPFKSRTAKVVLMALLALALLIWSTETVRAPEVTEVDAAECNQQPP